MKLRFLFLVLLIALLPAACATQPQTAENSPERAVEETFLTYKEALLARDGATGAALVTEDSWDYYRGMADEALTADRERLNELDFVDRLTALLFRHALTTDQLRRMSGEELVAVSIDNGWISRERTARMKLTDFAIDGERATAATVRRDGTPSSVRMGFERERGAWRLDLLEMIDISRKAMPLAIALSGKSQQELLFASLEQGTGRKPGPEIWNPPL